jgi:Protein of unknown function (DUF1566)
MMKIFFGILLFFAFSNAAQIMRDNLDELVIDKTNNLMWQDDITAKSVKGNWNEAIAYCSNLHLHGYSDWRVPIMDDLFSVRDESRTPAINLLFKNVQSEHYWSGSDVYQGKYGWSMNFQDGDDSTDPKSSLFYIRCVRTLENRK